MAMGSSINCKTEHIDRGCIVEFSCRDCSPVIVLYAIVHFCISPTDCNQCHFLMSYEVVLCELTAQEMSVRGR